MPFPSRHFALVRAPSWKNIVIPEYLRQTRALPDAAAILAVAAFLAAAMSVASAEDAELSVAQPVFPDRHARRP